MKDDVDISHLTKFDQVMDLDTAMVQNPYKSLEFLIFGVLNRKEGLQLHYLAS